MLSVTGEEIGLTVTSPPPSSTPSEYLFDTKCTDLLHQRCVAPIRVVFLVVLLLMMVEILAASVGRLHHTVYPEKGQGRVECKQISRHCMYM